MARKTPIREVFTTHKTHKADSGHQPPIEEFETLKKDANKYLAIYEGSVKTLK